MNGILREKLSGNKDSTTSKKYDIDLSQQKFELQEKLVGGMVEYSSGSKLRKARRIKNFQQDIKLNSELYELALEYAQ